MYEEMTEGAADAFLCAADRFEEAGRMMATGTGAVLALDGTDIEMPINPITQTGMTAGMFFDRASGLRALVGASAVAE